MMRKYVSRLLALVLVLCMVVLCVPVRAYADAPVRPEGMTDEEWAEYLRKWNAVVVAEETVAADTATITSSTTNLDGTETPASPPAASSIPEQSVTVVVPVDENATVASDTVTSEGTVTKPVLDGEGKPTGETETTDVTIEEKYDVDATVKEVEITDGEITDITYDVSLDKTTTVTDEDGEKISETTVPDIDVEENKKAADTGAPAPQYNVNLSVNGMKDAPTRVEHKYTKKVSTGEGTEETVEETEYYYNAANGIDEADNSKKYFTVSEVEKESETAGVVSTVTEKVVSLWTSFLGIFHITNDAFEGTEQADGTKDTYANLSAAAGANDGKTVEMLRDYETDKSAVLDENVTVDMNGHTYTNTGSDAAITASGNDVSVKNGEIYSGGDGARVTGGKFSLKNIFLKSNAKNTNTGTTAGIRANGNVAGVSVDNSGIDGSNSRYGIVYDGSDAAKKGNLTVRNSSVVGGTGIAVDDANASISGSYVEGIGKAAKGTDSGAAVAVSGKSTVEITSGLFDSARAVDNIYAADKDASISITGGRFTDPDHLYSYLPRNRVVISHNDDSYFLYEVVGTDYVPSRDGYRFLGYTDGSGNAITLAEAARKGIIAYAQWKEIPEKIASALTVNDLIKVKTDEKNCTTKVTVKGDTAYVTVKDADGEFAPISEVKALSVKKLQLLKIDTIEIQVDEDVALVLDIEKAKENGFADTIEVTLEKDTLMITSGKDTCIELDIAVLKAADKPVEIQLVEGELTVLLGKSSELSVDLTEALKTGERIVVKLENGVLKLYDKYNNPIEEN